MVTRSRVSIHQDARLRHRVPVPAQEVALSDTMAGASLEQAPPEFAGGMVVLQWDGATPRQPRPLREKRDWEWIQAPASMVASLSEEQRSVLRGLVIDPSPGMNDFTLEGEFPMLERINFRIDLRLERIPPRLRSVTAAVKTERVKLAREWLPRCQLAHFEAYHPARADCLEAVTPEGVRFVELSACKGAPLALPRFVDATDLHIKQVRTLKNLDLLRTLQKLQELSLHYQASWENLDALDDLRSLRLVELDSCTDKNGALRVAVERLRSRGVLVRSVFTKSAGAPLEAKDF
jgi:hypothetical protein